MKREPILDEAQSPKLELRVLHGPQAGSRLLLTAGNYLLGNSDDCTIILNGPRIEAEHALIDFDDALPSITPHSGTVCDAQGNAVQDRFPLSFGIPIDLGGVWISIDHVDAPWPDPAAVIPINAGSPLVIPDRAAESISENVNDETRAAISQAENSTRYARKALIMSAVMLIVLLTLGGVVTGWFIFGSVSQESAQTESIDMQTTEPGYVGELRSKLENIVGNNSVKVDFTPQAGVIVSGYVRNAEIKTRIMRSLDTYTPAPTANIYTEEEILVGAKKLLHEKMNPSRAKLSVENINGGILSLTGVVTTPTVREEMIELLKNGVPGLNQIEATVLTTEDLPQKLEEEISNAGLNNRFRVVARQPEFILRGKLTENELRNWEKILLRFTEFYGSFLPIRANIGLIETKPPVNVEAIVGGTTPFIITKSGQRIERGGNINGNVLTTVRDSEIIFDGNERYRLGR